MTSSSYVLSHSPSVAAISTSPGCTSQLYRSASCAKSVYVMRHFCRHFCHLKPQEFVGTDR